MILRPALLRRRVKARLRELRGAACLSAFLCVAAVTARLSANPADESLVREHLPARRSCVRSARRQGSSCCRWAVRRRWRWRSLAPGQRSTSATRGRIACGRSVNRPQRLGCWDADCLPRWDRRRPSPWPSTTPTWF